MLAKKIGVLRLGYVNYPPVYYSRGDRRPSVLGLAWSVLVESAPPTYYIKFMEVDQAVKWFHGNTGGALAVLLST